MDNMLVEWFRSIDTATIGEKILVLFLFPSLCLTTTMMTAGAETGIPSSIIRARKHSYDHF